MNVWPEGKIVMVSQSCNKDVYSCAYGQQFPKVGKLLVHKLVNKILETVVHTRLGNYM